jgi:hypothetical protein
MKNMTIMEHEKRSFQKNDPTDARTGITDGRLEGWKAGRVEGWKDESTTVGSNPRRHFDEWDPPTPSAGKRLAAEPKVNHGAFHKSSH